jgi:hypothetical protein
MGAYYTPSDVTAYIVEMTILPWLLDAVASRCPEELAPRGPAWRMLADNSDRYVRAEVRHGVDQPLPCRCAAAPPAAVGLPTETWPELQARRRHCRELRQRLRDGTVHTFNDLVTLNLDIRTLVTDLLARSERSVVLALRQALHDIRVLDPTCGDGAFLMAALNLLDDVAGLCGERARESLLRRNIFGIDLDKQAVAHCRRHLAGPSAGVDGAANICQGQALTLNFPEVAEAGGFDVIIGNPPYIAARCNGYATNNYQTADCPDLYAWILERSAELLRPGGRTGMIVPLSLAFSGDFDVCRRLLFRTYSTNWFASFGRIPSALFAFDIRVRNTIHLGHKTGGQAGENSVQKTPRQYTTRLHRWFDEARPQLFSLLDYAEFRPEPWGSQVAKLSGPLLHAFERRLQETTARLGESFARGPTAYALHYKKTAYNWLTFCRKPPPCYDAQGRRRPQTQFDCLYFHEAWQRDVAMLLLNGKWVFSFWCAVGDDFHVTRRTLADFPIDLKAVLRHDRRRLALLARRIEQAMAQAVAFKRNAGKRVGTYNLARCRHVTDQSDRLFAKIMGLEELWPEVELLCAQTVKTDFASVAAPRPRAKKSQRHADFPA